MDGSPLDRDGSSGLAAAHDPLDARALRLPQGQRRFGAVNWLGLGTLIRREVLRFVNVWTQTLAAPAVTAGMFLAVFTLALGARNGGDPQALAAFLAPGIVMMTVLQNAFANTSSSIMVSKIQGNIVDTLMPPLSAWELTVAMTLGGVFRGMAVALLCCGVLYAIVGVSVANPLLAALFVILGAAFLSLLGLVAGIWSEKFDHIAAVTNFVVTPLAFLSGAFYSVRDLPEPWATVSLYNPFTYLIDGFRAATIGEKAGEALDPINGLLINAVCVAVLFALCWRLFSIGYKLKA